MLLAVLFKKGKKKTNKEGVRPEEDLKNQIKSRIEISNAFLRRSQSITTPRYNTEQSKRYILEIIY